MSSRQTVCVRKAAEREGLCLPHLQLESPCSESQQLRALLLLHRSWQKPQAGQCSASHRGSCSSAELSSYSHTETQEPSSSKLPAGRGLREPSKQQPAEQHCSSFPSRSHSAAPTPPGLALESTPTKAGKSAQLHHAPQFRNWSFSSSSKHNTTLSLQL